MPENPKIIEVIKPCFLLNQLLIIIDITTKAKKALPQPLNKPKI